MAATRHSGLECLRIISIILIVSMHILGNTFHTSNWLNKEFILFINTLGNTGVTLFILIQVILESVSIHINFSKCWLSYGFIPSFLI